MARRACGLTEGQGLSTFVLSHDSLVASVVASLTFLAPGPCRVPASCIPLRLLHCDRPRWAGGAWLPLHRLFVPSRLSVPFRLTSRFGRGESGPWPGVRVEPFRGCRCLWPFSWSLLPLWWRRSSPAIKRPSATATAARSPVGSGEDRSDRGGGRLARSRSLRACSRRVDAQPRGDPLPSRP